MYRNNRHTTIECSGFSGAAALATSATGAGITGSSMHPNAQLDGPSSGAFVGAGQSTFDGDRYGLDRKSVGGGMVVFGGPGGHR